MNRLVLIIVVLNMRGLSVSEKLAFANRILLRMTGNANFTTATPTLLILQGVIDALALAITNWQKGNALLTAQLHDAEAEVVRALRYMAAYVEYISHNDATIALSSGFAIKQDAAHPATGFRAKNGSLSGVADLKTDAVRGAAYIWQYSIDPATSQTWIGDKITNRAKNSFDGLTVGEKFWFRVALIINDEEQEFSDPVSLTIL